MKTRTIRLIFGIVAALIGVGMLFSGTGDTVLGVLGVLLGVTLAETAARSSDDRRNPE